MSSHLSLEELFSTGRFDEIVLAYENPKALFAVHEYSYLIGALSFLGRLFEATEIYRAHSKFFTPAHRSASIFFIAVGLVRKARFKKARRLFKLNQKLHGASAYPEAAFYSAQGIGFYLYFTGQFARAESYAKTAFQYSLQSESIYNKILAQDLLAYTWIQTGQVHAGLNMLQQTLDLALASGHKETSQALTVSILLVESEYGRRAQTMLAELNHCLNSLETQDNYSKSNVILELARQYILRGQWKKGEDLLNEQAPTIYAHENRRQEIRLNILWAKIAFLRGQSVLAWQYLRSAQMLLPLAKGGHLEVEILTAEIDILEEQNSPLLPEKKQRLLTLSSSFASGISRNILARKNWIQDLPAPEGNDVLHDLLIKIHSQSSTAVKTVSESGYYSWFYKCLELKRGAQYLVLGIQKNTVAIFSQDGIELHKIAEISRKILEVLRQGSLTKEQLLEKVWGYKYDPIRHDSLVYSAISNLRKSLGSHQLWVQTSEMGYYITNDVTVFKVGEQSEFESNGSRQSPAPKSSNIHVEDLSLNVRQIQALDYLKNKQFISTRQYKELFQTTEITASRDLAELHKKGYVVRVGKGRSTHYMLAQE